MEKKLRNASDSGDIEEVRRLLSEGININCADEEGFTPLHNATYYGHLDVVTILLDRGAQIDAATKDGFTPLMFGARKGHLKVVSVLLARGAFTEAVNKDGYTPLILAAWKGHVEVVSVLLARGALTTAADKNGNTPLILAAFNGHSKVVTILLNKGACIEAANKEGKTPLQMAQDKGQHSIVAELQRALDASRVMKKSAVPLLPKMAAKSSTTTAPLHTAAPSSLKNAAQSSTVTPSVTTASSSTMNSSSTSDFSAPPPSKPVNRQLDQFLSKYVDFFRDFNDISNTMSLDELLDNLMDLKTDVFLSHDWGVDHVNHRRVAEINTALKARGLVTWFDEERMEGGVHDRMQEGIDNCKCVVVFITRKYMEKVAGDDAGDNCQLEFNYAAWKKGNNKIVPVVMEPEVRDTRTWTGQVDFHLGGQLYVDLAEPILTKKKVDELQKRIMSIIGERLQSVIERLLQYNSMGTWGCATLKAKA
mmetsp:Transcript_7241/g.10229  ORF Transcript_7241/g.10229 Transcript_7241/m.10229 type:complete len:478 (+) Transcript_7241:96-1529(+)